MGGFFAGFTEVALAKVGMEADIGRGTDELVEVWQAVCPHPRRPVFRRGQDMGGRHRTVAEPRGLPSSPWPQWAVRETS